MSEGLFITFEGGEGSGKSTQIEILAERMRASYDEVVKTREPGGTPSAEAVRRLLVSGATDSWSPQAEALLNYAARDSHLNQVIRPALRRGACVISDRFVDSTYVYQGVAGGCSLELIEHLREAIVADTMPSITFVMDLDPRAGLARAGERRDQAEDRFERMGKLFHDTVRTGFRQIAKANPDRCHLIDASQSVDETAAKIAEIIAAISAA